MIKPVCPKCKFELIKKGDNAICRNCGSIFPITKGIISFVQKDKFYEGKFGAAKVRKSSLKRAYSKIAVSGISYRSKHEKLYKKLKTSVNMPIKVLDVGCGGGNISLKSYEGFYVVGIDLSISSLLNAQKIYDQVHQASVTSIPFPDNTFDCVCSFDLLGHIPLVQKDVVFNEISRVLKTGGLSFHYIEVDAPRGINNWAKKYPSLYKKYFIELEGHFGLEHIRDVMGRFEKHDFELLNQIGMCEMIRPLGQISIRLDDEYKYKCRLLKIIVTLDKLLKKNLIIRAISGVILKPFELIFEPLIPNDYCGLLYVAYKKK